jgi:hypothetical protein
MRKEHLSLILLLMLSVLLCATAQTDWQKMGLKGKVQIIEEENSATLFDENGFITLTEIGGRYALASTVNYIYDSEFRLLSREQTDDSATVLNADYYTYDESGLLTKHKEYSLSNTYVHDFTYTADKHISTKKTYDYYGKLTQAIEFYYDETGAVAEEHYYNSNMEFTHYKAFSYDEQYNLEECLTADPKQNQIRKFEYKYNSRYQPIEEIITQEKQITYKINTRYDEHGNIVEKISYQPDSNRTTKQTHEYEYDEQGNWTNHKLFLDSALQSEEYRTLTYYTE